MKSEEKSLGVGLHTFCTRVFGKNSYFFPHPIGTILNTR